MSTANKIKFILMEKNMPLSELASKLNTSSQNLSAKLKRDNLSEKDLQAIANVLDCDLEIRFIDKNTKEHII